MNNSWHMAIEFGFMGLLVGSFLNVVIHRLPKMMEMQWDADCREHVTGVDAQPSESFNLMVPRSRCPNCGHQIKWHENIPVLSYLFLRGKCSACAVRISVRYPLVELVTGGFFMYCARRWGAGIEGLLWCAFSATLIALTMIDWDTTLLPDDMTLPLLWGGLAASALHWSAVPLDAAVWGAIGGYGALWLVYWAFKLLTGKEGMGYGDFKLFAALGVWFGWTALTPIILMASVIGGVVGITMKFTTGLREAEHVPFGPFLCMAGFTAMVFGPQSILRVVGL